MKTWLFLVMVALVVPGSGSLAVHADPAIDAMKALPRIEGRWAGEGWMRMGPGEPMRFVGEETVEARLDGRLLVVEGLHRTPDRSKVVHHAFGVFSWDENAKNYRFTTYVANRGGGEHVARMEGNALVWDLAGEGPKRRFTITVENDQWKEVGHVQLGDKWVQFFEMTLSRVK
jgi:hypothetical protein